MKKLNPYEYINKKYNHLKIIDYVGYVKNNHIFKVQCDCKYKTIKEIRLSDLKSSNPTKSCGKCQGKHLLSNTRLYRTWKGMKTRCYNPNNISYVDYGAKGIKLCDEWKDDFYVFYKWATESGYSDDLTIDRIDVDGDYEPDNCQWLTRSKNTIKSNKQRIYKGFVKVKCISPNGEVYITENKSEFARNHNLDPSAITKVCKGIYKHHKNWKFTYVD